MKIDILKSKIHKVTVTGAGFVQAMGVSAGPVGTSASWDRPSGRP